MHESNLNIKGPSRTHSKKSENHAGGIGATVRRDWSHSYLQHRAPKEALDARASVVSKLLHENQSVSLSTRYGGYCIALFGSFCL